MESVQGLHQGDAGTIVVDGVVGLLQALLRTFQSLLRTDPVDGLRGFGGIGDDREYALVHPGDPSGQEEFLAAGIGEGDLRDARLYGEDRIGVTGKDADLSIHDAQDDLFGFALSGDLFRIDDGGGQSHLDFNSLPFSTASSMVPT